MEPVEIASAFVSERFQLTDIAIMAGSSASGQRTATSDIDLLLIGPESMFERGRSSLAATFAYSGEPIELFAYTGRSFEEWVKRDLTARRPVLLTMLLEGNVIRGAGRVDRLRDKWRPVFEAGPLPTEHELEARRYAVTDLLDDLRDATDVLEQRVTAGLLFEKLAELLLLSDGHWIGSSKHLVRAMRAWNARRTEQLAVPLIALDFNAFADRVSAELRLLGGRVQTGFVR